jgi:drug/metabolite transporter (DMT)-like permease
MPIPLMRKSVTEALSPSRPPERRLYALGLRLFGCSCLSIMTVFIKLAAEHGVATPEMMFWRQAFAVPVVLAFVMATGGLASLRTEKLGLHMSRTVFGLLIMMLTFSSYIFLPLAEATTLGFTTPIFATLLSAVILKERIRLHRSAAIIAGFIGVLILVQPGSGHIPPIGVLIGLTSAFGIGCMSLLIRQLGKTENSATTVFYFSVLSVPLMLPFLYFYGSAHDSTGWMLLIMIGLIGGIGQIAFTASLRFAPVSVVVAMDYVSLLWTSLAGWFVWQHMPSAATWIGAPIIIASGLYIAWREHRLQIERAKEEIV